MPSKPMTHRFFAAIWTVLLCGFFMNADAASPRFDYTAWEDFGVVHSVAEGDAYYPSVIYDQKGFGGEAPLYKMWYTDGSGNVYMVTSADGFEWSEEPTAISGLKVNAHHVQVIYDAGGFGDPQQPAYRMWYWNTANVYRIEAIGYSESDDGINWALGQSVAQDNEQVLVTGNAPDWNAGSYGPISISYQPDAINEGKFPFDYSFVLYYDATNGSDEFTGLAYSEDGITWVAHGDEPVLAGGDGPAWDCSDAAYGTFYRDDSGYHFWYSGGGGDDDKGGCRPGPVHEGIGYAFSPDGIKWQKDSANPIFHIDDGVVYRNERVYTPAVVKDAQGNLSMFYSVRSEAEGNRNKKIAMARLFPTLSVDIDIRPGWIPLPGKYKWWRRVNVAVLSSADFDAGSQVVRDSLTFGRSGYEQSLKICSSRLRDANRDGYDDLICYFDRHRTGFQCGDKVGTLRGMTVDGYPLEGTDRVRIFPCRDRR